MLCKRSHHSYVFYVLIWAYWYIVLHYSTNNDKGKIFFLYPKNAKSPPHKNRSTNFILDTLGIVFLSFLSTVWETQLDKILSRREWQPWKKQFLRRNTIYLCKLGWNCAFYLSYAFSRIYSIHAIHAIHAIYAVDTKV